MAKYVTAQEAVTHIKSGDRVVLAHSVGEPQHLVNAMVDNYQAYQNVEVCHMLALGPCKYCAPCMEGHFIHNSLFAGPGSRKAVSEARADFTPNFFFESPKLFYKGDIPIDVAMITVSPPDEHGYCSYGITVDYTKAAAESATIVIAQVNQWMPRTYGDTLIHIDDIDFAVEYDEPLFYLPKVKSSNIEEKIGAYCASLIGDGACLQLGIGAIPNAVLGYLGEKNDLGVHSEMLMDGILPLIEKGNVNNSRKKIHKGVSVVTFLYGSENLYQYANNNPRIKVYPVDYVNNPIIIAKNPNVVSINSAISVDFMGQVSADTVSSERHHSGAGGFVDFIRGASFSDGGISIIAMPSTAAGGSASRIVSEFEAGRPVTLSRFESHYIVTEYGIANMRGHTLRDRARNLIQISHPDFRDQLKEAFEKKFRQPF
jgi:4-hydroxybutyrate CoA-transferase